VKFRSAAASWLVLLGVLGLGGAAQAQEGASSSPGSEELAENEETALEDVSSDPGTDRLSSLRRPTASGRYVAPTFVFNFHGYATLTLAEVGGDLGTEANATPQILLPGVSPRTGTNESGFRNDAAIFVGGSPLEGLNTIIELHFLGNALDPVITEAKAEWQFLNTDRVRMRAVGGRYWWPFGIHDVEWFSAVNAFPVVSAAAAEVVPAHYNEVGVAAEGEVLFSDEVGLNGIVSVGNGVPGFEISDTVGQTPFDYNGNRTITGRLAFALLGDVKLELGGSGSAGRLRSGQDMALDAADVHRYAASFYAFGVDLQAAYKGLSARGYYYWSQEDLDQAPVDALDRKGFTGQLSYDIKVGIKHLKKFSVVGRVSMAQEDVLDGTTTERWQLGGALRCWHSDNLVLNLGYTGQYEKQDAEEQSNNVLNATASLFF